LTDTTDKDFGSLLLLISRNGSFRVDLIVLAKYHHRKKTETHYLVVEVMLLDHDYVDGLGVFESQETETARPTSSSISHDSALSHLAE